MKEKVVIIGSGLGGLECGYILAKHGFDVTVLERARRIGGCLQSFMRGGTLFDTGFHYVGGLDEGQPLNRLFRYYGLMNLPWHRLDSDCFDEVIIGEERFPFASGHEEFARRLSDRFPAEKDNILKYTAFLKGVGDHIFDSFDPRDTSGFYSTSLFAQSAHDFLCETIRDPLLRKVLSGTSLKMELDAESLPLYVFAQINNSFIQSAWRLRGGGSQIAERLASAIRSMGGRVLTDSEVTAIRTENDRAVRVAVGRKSWESNAGTANPPVPENVPVDPSGSVSENGAAGRSNSCERQAADDYREYEADWVISDAHPSITVALVEPAESLRRIYRKRMTSHPNTFGMFTANIALKDKAFPYLNKNIFIHRADADLWHPLGREGRADSTQSVLVSFAVPKGEHAESVDLLSPMTWEEVRRWADLPPGGRGEEYAEFKLRKLRDCIKLVGRHMPQLEEAIDGGRAYCSTPLTYDSYLASPGGGAYGLRKDWRDTMGTVLAPVTPIPNLLLTGQSLNLHGILGVSMTSVFTCGVILGTQALAKEILSDG